jgi:hypothetical protein
MCKESQNVEVTKGVVKIKDAIEGSKKKVKNSGYLLEMG